MEWAAGTGSWERGLLFLLLSSSGVSQPVLVMEELSRCTRAFRLRRTMARTGVSARGAPAQRPSCGQGGRGGGLGGWCWERGGAPVVKHRVAPGTGQQTKGLPVFFPSLSLPLLHGNIFYFQTVGVLFGFFLISFPPPISPSLPAVFPWGHGPSPGVPLSWQGAAEVPRRAEHRCQRFLLPPHQHNGDIQAATTSPSTNPEPETHPPPPPLAIPVPPYRCLPNSSMRQKAADAVSQRAGGGELESSITKQALCTLPS